MNLKLRHIVIIFTSLLLMACAMETNKAESSTESYDLKEAEENLEMTAEYEIAPTINADLINQKLQDFYDLVALQNEHPEFMDDVSYQLKNYTTDSISDFSTKDFTVIKNIQQLDKVVFVNDSVQRIKLTYDKVMNNTKKRDTIYAIITNKTVTIDGEVLISNKIQFSKH